jgi:hypothetical protein
MMMMIMVPRSRSVPATELLASSCSAPRPRPSGGRTNHTLAKSNAVADWLGSIRFFLPHVIELDPTNQHAHTRSSHGRTGRGVFPSKSLVLTKFLFLSSSFSSSDSHERSTVAPARPPVIRCIRGKWTHPVSMGVRRRKRSVVNHCRQLHSVWRLFHF